MDSNNGRAAASAPAYITGTIRSGGNSYVLYRAIIDGRGVWTARQFFIDGTEGAPFRITYEQARGMAPIRPTGVDSISRTLGSVLLPHTHGKKATT